MYKQGHIKPFWTNEFKSLNYYRQEFNNADDITLWRKQGFTQQNFTGEMFSLFEEGQIKWADKFFTIFNGKHTSINFYKMNTCDILPYHCDIYKKFKEIHSLDEFTTITRVLIFMENRKEGHIFEVDGKLIDWNAGDYVLWTNDVPHMAANIGLEPRYTTQVTFIDV